MKPEVTNLKTKTHATTVLNATVSAQWVVSVQSVWVFMGETRSALMWCLTRQHMDTGTARSAASNSSCAWRTDT
jgi:hypothetical protein